MLLKVSLFTLFVVSVFTAAAKAQDLVGYVRANLDDGRRTVAESVLEQYKSARGVTPEYLEAYSWLARDSFGRKNYREAMKLAGETYKLSADELKHRKLDAEPHLPIALGAAIEVHAQALAAEGNRAAAVNYLDEQLQKFHNTSIITRLRKNLNLLSLEGKPAPALHESEYLGSKPEPLSTFRGKPVLLFFWAHWCVDCKAEAPILARLKRELGDEFVLIGPTQRYGYGAAGTDISPGEELQYIDSVRQKYYAPLADMPVPVSAADFEAYGVSTTPTLVLVGREGRVRMYHPGRMTYDELKAQLQPLIARSR